MAKPLWLTKRSALPPGLLLGRSKTPLTQAF